MDREVIRGRGISQLNVDNNKRKDRADAKQNNTRVKRRKYALLGEDWGLLETPDPTRVQTKTPVEVLGCMWKRRPLAIKWDGWGTKVLVVESHGEVEINPPVDRVKCVLPELNEFESNPLVSLVESMNNKLEGVKNESSSENENEKSLSMIRKYEKKPENKTVGKVTKRKTWTKLNNGLFGWKTINAKQTTSNSSKLEKCNYLPAIKGDQSSKISTGKV